MNILVIGATGGTGRQIVAQALDLGHTVTAFVRNPNRMKTAHARLKVVKGNVLDYESIEQAMLGQDAVLSALGHKRWLVRNTILSDGTKNIIRGMKSKGVRRFICETTLGIGDTRGRLGLYYTLFVIPVIVFYYFRDKELQEEYIRQSGLDWTIVRTGQLTNRRKKGEYRHGRDIGSYLWTVSISRADVADFMLKQLTDNKYLGQAVTVAN